MPVHGGWQAERLAARAAPLAWIPTSPKAAVACSCLAAWADVKRAKALLIAQASWWTSPRTPPDGAHAATSGRQAGAQPYPLGGGSVGRAAMRARHPVADSRFGPWGP